MSLIPLLAILAVDASSSSMVLNHTFPQHASSFVGHFASLLLSPPLPILSNMQRPQSAQSSSSKRRRSSAQASQTQTDASANLGLQHTASSSKRLKKNPVVSDEDGTPKAEDNWWTDRKIDWEKDCGGESHQSSFAFSKIGSPPGLAKCTVPSGDII